MIKAIDVSEYQKNIDFVQVKKAGYHAVIIRYADGMHLDPYFDANMKKANAAGLHVGAYIYSRAVNVEQARQEAQRIIKAVKPYKIDLPLYIDLEVETSNMLKFCNSYIEVFIEEVEKAGYLGGVYANYNWFTNYINVNKIKNKPLWLAQYNKLMTYKHPEYIGMWQYTSKGRVPGISGNVDLNYLYVEYWKKPEPDFSDKIKVMAVDVLLDKYGTGEKRKQLLGSNYEEVQKLVNRLIQIMGG